MPVDIVETATKGTTLSVPIGTDKRKASSLTAAWQAIANRLKFAEDFFDALTGLGSTLVITDDTEWEVADGKVLKIRGSAGAGDGVLDLTLITAHYSGSAEGPLVSSSFSGRVPKKYERLTATGTFNPMHFDYVACVPSGTMNLTFDVTDAALFEDGDHVLVVLNAAQTLNIKASGGATQVTLTTAGSWVELIYEASAFGSWDGGWYIARRFTA